MNEACPLCQSVEIKKIDEDKLRPYLKCHHCSLIFVPRSHLISTQVERERYESHNNSEDDPHYRHYLSQIADVIKKCVRRGTSGLDFGCGKTTVLESLMKADGFKVDSYDVFFRPDPSLWNKKYDFIVLSEVIEHLRDPLQTMLDLKSILHPDGLFFVKTEFSPGLEKFSQWFYKRDITHVQFFDEFSFDCLAEKLGMKSSAKFKDQDLYLLTEK